ncbi:developing brain homeobox-like protein, partial [Dinothrombium tinctorium]
MRSFRVDDILNRSESSGVQRDQSAVVPQQNSDVCSQPQQVVHESSSSSYAQREQFRFQSSSVNSISNSIALQEFFAFSPTSSYSYNALLRDPSIFGLCNANFSQNTASAAAASAAQFTFIPAFHPYEYSFVTPPQQIARKRTVFSRLQRRELEATFQRQRYISKPERLQLAEKIGLNDAQLVTMKITLKTLLYLIGLSLCVIGFGYQLYLIYKFYTKYETEVKIEYDADELYAPGVTFRLQMEEISSLIQKNDPDSANLLNKTFANPISFAQKREIPSSLSYLIPKCEIHLIELHESRKHHENHLWRVPGYPVIDFHFSFNEKLSEVSSICINVHNPNYFFSDDSYCIAITKSWTKLYYSMRTILVKDQIEKKVIFNICHNECEKKDCDIVLGAIGNLESNESNMNIISFSRMTNNEIHYNFAPRLDLLNVLVYVSATFGLWFGLSVRLFILGLVRKCETTVIKRRRESICVHTLREEIVKQIDFLFDYLMNIVVVDFIFKTPKTDSIPAVTISFDAVYSMNVSHYCADYPYYCGGNRSYEEIATFIYESGTSLTKMKDYLLNTRYLIPKCCLYRNRKDECKSCYDITEPRIAFREWRVLFTFFARRRSEINDKKYLVEFSDGEQLIEIEVQHTDSNPYYTKVFIHSPECYPNYEDVLFDDLVFRNQILLSYEKKRTKLYPRTSGCKVYGNKNYETQNGCYLNCIAKKHLAMCKSSYDRQLNLYLNDKIRAMNDECIRRMNIKKFCRKKCSQKDCTLDKYTTNVLMKSALMGEVSKITIKKMFPYYYTINNFRPKLEMLDLFNNLIGSIYFWSGLSLFILLSLCEKIFNNNYLFLQFLNKGFNLRKTVKRAIENEIYQNFKRIRNKNLESPLIKLFLLIICLIPATYHSYRFLSVYFEYNTVVETSIEIKKEEPLAVVQLIARTSDIWDLAQVENIRKNVSAFDDFTYFTVFRGIFFDEPTSNLPDSALIQINMTENVSFLLKLQSHVTPKAIFGAEGMRITARKRLKINLSYAKTAINFLPKPFSTYCMDLNAKDQINLNKCLQNCEANNLVHIESFSIKQALNLSYEIKNYFFDENMQQCYRRCYLQLCTWNLYKIVKIGEEDHESETFIIELSSPKRNLSFDYTSRTRYSRLDLIVYMTHIIIFYLGI